MKKVDLKTSFSGSSNKHDEICDKAWRIACATNKLESFKEYHTLGYIKYLYFTIYSKVILESHIRNSLMNNIYQRTTNN